MSNRRSGRTAVLVLLVLALAVAAAVVGPRLVSEGGGRGAADPAAPRGAPPAERPPPAARDSPEPGPEEPDPEERVPAGAEVREPAGDLVLSSGPAADDGRRFRGVGGVRGRVELRGPNPLPERWTLVIRPSLTMPGSESAVERTALVEGAEFRVEDLPFGGYDLSVRIPGLNGPRHPVVIDRVNHSPYVHLTAYPTGFLEGRLVDAAGAPEQGVEVHLEAQPEGARTTLESDALGRFRFESVPDGSYRLVVGPPTNPLVEPRRLSFRAPSMSLPDFVLPKMAELSVLVLDPDDVPVPGAEVRGSGNRGGLVEGTTDALGRLLARNLPAGRYRVRAELPGVGAMRVTVDLAEGEEGELVVRLR